MDAAPHNVHDNRSRGGARSTLTLALAGTVITYLSHPPAGLGFLAWIGPAAWIYIAGCADLPGRRPYQGLWLAGIVYWLLTIAWLRLPHPANWAALAFVAAYLGLYLPTFVGLTRVAVHRLRVPIWLAAPVVWTGLELVRSHLLTGLLMGSLAHTQVRDFPAMLQLAEFGGEYAVTFTIMLAASLFAQARLSAEQRMPRDRPPTRADSMGGWRSAAWNLAWMTCILATLGIGRTLQVNDGANASTRPTARIALIQSDMLADWKGTPQRDREVMRQQERLSTEAVRGSDQPVDLIVWPETMFRMPLHQLAPGYEPPSDLFRQLYGATSEEVIAGTTDYLVAMARDLDTAVLVGIDRKSWREPREDEPPMFEGLPRFGVDSFNSCVMIDRTGEAVGTYDKMHLLPFGEYVPLVDWIPLLRTITPITGGAVPGEGPAALTLPLAREPQRQVRYAPNICYETALPHLIRRQVAELAERGEAPDVLVNLTNDAWYWGSAELDMHLAAGVLRAVETRTPLVIAANRGLSAHIDKLGNVQAVTQRDTAAKLVVDVDIGSRGPRSPTFYVRYGDWLPGACLVCCMVFAIVGWRDRRTATATAV